MVKQGKKKKVLYIITKSVWAGAGKYVYDLATELPKKQFEVFVAAGGDGELAQKLKGAGVSYSEIKHFQRDVSIFGDIFSFLEVLALLLRTHPDIVHVSSSKAGGISGIALFFYKAIRKIQKPRCKIQAIFTAHGWAFAEKRSKLQVALIKLFSRLTCLFYKKIICVSEFDHRLAIKNHIARKKKLTTIHNGIKLDEYNFLTKEKAKESLLAQITQKQIAKTHIPKLLRPQEDGDMNNEKNIWIGTIGEFTKNKGQEFLIEATKNLQATSYKLQAIIIGFGEEHENLKSQISNLKLEDKVFLVENLQDAPKHLKAFDVFVLPSLKEGLPYTLLEAGLARLPVVASDVGGIPEIIENEKTGLLVEAENSEKIKEGIEKIIESPELKSNLSYALWEKVHQEFRFEQMLERTISAYENKS